MKLISSLHHNHPSSRHPQDSLFHRVANDPYLDWLILVVCAVVLTAVVVTVDILTYTSTQATLTAPITTSVGGRATLLDTQALADTLNNFEVRAEEEAALMKGYGGVSDPSL